MQRLLLSAYLGAAILARPDRRIVDRIVIGDARSEQQHACAKTAAWMRCALTTFDDTEVTIAATVAGSDEPQTFELVVENRTITMYTFNSRDSATVELRVPLDVTAGRTNIQVLLRGPARSLLLLRTIQDHNE